jgi:hypothetical protein
MNPKTITVIVSAITAFVIAAGGAVVVVVGSGNTLNRSAMVMAVGLGLVSAAKDTRSLLSLPPVSEAGRGLMERALLVPEAPVIQQQNGGDAEKDK